MRKPKKKTLRLKADKLWRNIVSKAIVCERCGKIGGNAHHVIGRNNLRLRYDLQNSCYLCIGCHFEAHEDPLGFIEWFYRQHNDDYFYLQQAKNETVTTTVEWYQDNIKRLKEILGEVDNEF